MTNNKLTYDGGQILGVLRMMLRVSALICAASVVLAHSASSTARPADQNHSRLNTVANGSAIIGIASTYNPFRPGYRSGGSETASGDPYDPTAWTAAIQTNLRERFGGVRYGRNYRPTYALVSTADQQAIVKVNDVGPLEPGRVIDLNEQTMRYFDPNMQRGLIPITVIPLGGNDWSPGPVAEKELMSIATLQFARMKLAGLSKVLFICDL
jgi:rare lipoprotein A